jgi:hypothetical protein
MMMTGAAGAGAGACDQPVRSVLVLLCCGVRQGGRGVLIKEQGSQRRGNVDQKKRAHESAHAHSRTQTRSGSNTTP